jgi:two-component system CheB/CheR fusion protein
VDGYISYWNKAAEETYGFTSAQALGRKMHELLLAAPSYETFAADLRQNGHWTGEVVHTRRDAQKIIVESRMVVVTDTTRRQLVVQADRPITERKESERVLRNLADNLVAADRNKDEFLAMLAHELRNPLAPLRNIVSVLQSEAIEDEQKERALSIMERQIQNMARLIDDLLDVSRITLSQIELRKAPFDIVLTLRQVAEQNEPLIKSKKQTLHVHLPDEALYVEGDAVRLEQIVGNLVNNAMKYTPAGGEIWLSAERTVSPDKAGLDEIAIRVKDNGIGIDPDKLPRVFDLFMRATRSIDHRYGGLGLGLTLVRRFAELHGGRVEARSEGAGRGSEFVVRLPMIRLAAEFVGSGSAEAPTARTMRRVLVVDDSLDNIEATAMTLRMAGHEVAIAENGLQALDVARDFRPNVALIDIGMPDMNGYELAKRLRASIDHGLQLVAVSGYGEADAQQRARDAGFDDYLVKPASLRDIQRVMEKAAAG